jgi:programmed cell death protein 5
MDELEAIRARKLQQMQAHQQDSQQLKMQEAMRQIDALVNRYLTPEAKTRLSNLAMVDPELVQKLKVYFAQMASAGQLKTMDDEQLREILLKLKGTQRDITIKRV